VSNSDNSQLPAKVKVMLMSASQPLLTYTADTATSGSFVFNQILPGEYRAIVTVDASVESKSIEMIDKKGTGRGWRRHHSAIFGAKLIAN
jgi:hypothetical protein